MLRYTFVATGATTTLNFGQLRTNYSMHIYGVSNEQVFNNTWSPGGTNSYSTPANWSTGVVPTNLPGSNASFSAQAGPTSVTLPNNRTVGHVEILGTGSYTLNGILLKFSADVGGVSVLSTQAGGSHTIDASIQLLSDTMKVGAGTLTFVQDVSGPKGLNVAGGTLRFGLENNYTGGTVVGSGAILDLNATNQTFFGGLTGAGTIVNDTTGTSQVTVESGSFSGSIRDHNVGTGIVALTKTTNGTMTLSGANTYTGGTAVNAGTLRLQGTASTVLLTDNFLAPNNPNTGDLNFNLANRQTGTAALQSWTPANNTQVGNPTAVQQSAGTYGNYLLLAFGASATLNGLPLSTVNVPGPLKVNFDVFKGNAGDASEWTSFTMRSAGGNGFPITGSGEFGFLYRKNTGIQIFNNGGVIENLGSTSGGDSFGFYLADSAGTGSPFAGNGTRLVVTQGGGVLGSYALDASMAASTFITFGSGGGMIGGVDNLAVTPITLQTNVLDPATSVSLNAAGAVLKLEDVDQTVSSLTGVAGSAVNMLPFSRLRVNGATSTAFNGTITGPLASLVKAGSSVLELGAANSYTGGTTISGGTIIAHNAAALGTGTVSVAAGANYLPWFNTGTPVILNNFTLSGLGGNPGDGNKGAIYADGGGGAGYADYVLTGSVTLAATSDIGGNNANNQRLLGKVTGPGGLTKGSGRVDENSALFLSNPANDYAGDTTISNGTLKLGTSEVIPHGAGKGKVIINAGGTLDLAGSNERINNLSGTGAIVSSAGIVIGGPVFFTDDAGTGISGSKTYTHALDFADGASVINTVPFTAAGVSGGNWNLAGAPTIAGNGATGATGAISGLLTNFYYNGNPATLTLTGLAAGTTYDLHLYQRQWGGDRTQLFAFNAGPSAGAISFNEDASATPSYLSFRYTADVSGTATLNTFQLGAGTYHWYGLTNEVVVAAPDPILTVGDATNSTYSGAITGALEIEKVGTGTLTLDGALSFTELTVTEGRVNLNSALNNAIIDADAGILVVNASLTGTTVNVGATDKTYFTASQNLTALNIANGGYVEITAGPVPGFEAAAQAVPEPGSATLLLGGLTALLGLRRRKV